MQALNNLPCLWDAGMKCLTKISGKLLVQGILAGHGCYTKLWFGFSRDDPRSVTQLAVTIATGRSGCLSYQPGKHDRKSVDKADSKSRQALSQQSSGLQLITNNSKGSQGPVDLKWTIERVTRLITTITTVQTTIAGSQQVMHSERGRFNDGWNPV